MCTMSMIMDHKYDEWNRRYVAPPFDPNAPYPTQPRSVPPITQEEVDEFRRLLERARQYDKDHNQPDCELEEKRQKIRELAEVLGVDVSFI